MQGPEQTNSPQENPGFAPVQPQEPIQQQAPVQPQPYAQPAQMYQQAPQYPTASPASQASMFTYVGLGLFGLAILLQILAQSFSWSAWLLLLPMLMGFGAVALGIMAAKNSLATMLIIVISGGLIAGIGSTQTMISSLIINARYSSAIKSTSSTPSSSSSSKQATTQEEFDAKYGTGPDISDYDW